MTKNSLRACERCKARSNSYELVASRDFDHLARSDRFKGLQRAWDQRLQVFILISFRNQNQDSDGQVGDPLLIWHVSINCNHVPLSFRGLTSTRFLMSMFYLNNSIRNYSEAEYQRQSLHQSTAAFQRQLHDKLASLCRHALNRDGSSMRLDYPFGNRQA
jgi:hypothetical protein